MQRDILQSWMQGLEAYCEADYTSLGSRPSLLCHMGGKIDASSPHTCRDSPDLINNSYFFALFLHKNHTDRFLRHIFIGKFCCAATTGSLGEDPLCREAWNSNSCLSRSSLWISSSSFTDCLYWSSVNSAENRIYRAYHQEYWMWPTMKNVPEHMNVP